MTAYVFTDPGLTKDADRFVWLTIDVDNQNNADFLGKFKVNSLPTLLVLDPAEEQVVLQWFGSATLPQLQGLLDDGERYFHERKGDPVVELLARADRLNGSREFKQAACEYEKVLHLSSADWPRRSRVIASLVFALEEAGDMGQFEDLFEQSLRTFQEGEILEGSHIYTLTEKIKPQVITAIKDFR
jgi:hypothetical protein